MGLASPPPQALPAEPPPQSRFAIYCLSSIMICSGGKGQEKCEAHRGQETGRNVPSPFPLPAGGPILTSSCSPRRKESIAPHSVPHSPQPPRKACGGIRYSCRNRRELFLVRPRTMHEEIRTGPPYGNALSNPILPRSPKKDNPVFSKSRGGPPTWYTGR